MAQPKIGDVIFVDVDDVKPMPSQPRIIFDESEQESLANSLQSDGQATLIKVATIPGATNKPRFQLIDGERRWRGARAKGIKTLRAELAPWKSDLEMYEEAGRANLGSPLHPYERILFCKRLAEEGGYTAEEVARRAVLNIKTAQLYLRIGRFLHLDVIEMIRPDRPPTERLRIMVALSLCSLNHEKQREIAPRLCGLTGDQAAAIIRTHREETSKGTRTRRFTGNARSISGLLTLRDRNRDSSSDESRIRDEDLTPRRGRRPSDDYYSFAGAIERLLRKSTSFRFDQAAFRKMFSGRNDEDRGAVLRSIDQITRNLSVMRDRIAKTRKEK